MLNQRGTLLTRYGEINQGRGDADKTVLTPWYVAFKWTSFFWEFLIYK